MTTAMKKCPRCASDVPAEASVCAHCRSRLPMTGPGWWEASDGLLYPPWQHPDFPRNMPPVQRNPMSTRSKILAVAGGLACLAIIAVGATADEEAGDVLGEEACDEFADLRDLDLYTMEELREQVQQVYRDGQYADSADLRYYSRLLVSTVTNGDTVGFRQAVDGMADACAAL